MGGSVSGGWYRWDKKETTESKNQINIFYMNKQGFLNPGTSGKLSWSVHGEETDSIGFRIESGFMILNYKCRVNSSTWENIEERISITTTPCNYGGHRKWFLCPGCGHRVAILYGGKYFRCRSCLNLSYACQQETTPFRLFRKVRKIRSILGAGPDTDEPIFVKPKGMHQKTFDRLKEEAYKANEQAWEAMTGEAGIKVMNQFRVGIDQWGFR